MISTPWAARNSARSSWPGSSRTVRLQRSITCAPSSRARLTSSLKWGFSSGAPGDVERADAGSLEVAQHGVHRLPVHLLGARGAGVDVAVHAGLVALVAEVDLKRFETLAAYRR